MAQGKISSKQSEILEYIKAEILRVGYPPAVREICEAVHLKSTSSVHSHLETLEKNGYIRRDPTKPRTIEILDDDFALTRREMVNVPVVGTVAAGQPILAEENIEDYSQAMDAPQVSDEPAVPEMELEQFIDLSAEEYENADSQQVLDSEYVYTKRSVIHKAEEIEATSKLQPVQKVLDLFGGEIVDIHA